MVPSEIIKKVKKIEIKTRRIVNTMMSGGYHSAFKGRGIEFSEVRKYLPGDDIRFIDWNVTARSSEPYVKVFHEERELTVVLAVDISSSLAFGTRYGLKSEIAAEIAALLAFSAINNNDNVGLMLFSDRTEKYIPPKKGKKHVLRVIREILYNEPQSNKTSISNVIEQLSSTLRRKSLIFMLSDFYDGNWKKPMAILSKRHDVIPIVLSDPYEQGLVTGGLIEIVDNETGEAVVIDMAAKETLEKLRTTHEKFIAELENLFISTDIKPIYVSSEESYINPIRKYFKYRENRRVR